MLGLDRVFNALVPSGVSSRVQQAWDWAKAHADEPLQLVSNELRGLVDRVELATGHAPKGPFPSMKDLAAKFPQAGLPQRMIGTTIDDAAMNQPGMTPDKLMDRAKSLGYNTVRLGAYWDMIQPSADGKPDFSRLDALMAAANKRGLRVVLTVGAKAPNWPEFHVPGWAMPANVKDPCSSDAFRAATLNFSKLVSARYADNPALAMWQVENEPFDPSGPKKGVMRPEEVAAEAAILRKADGGKHPLMINVWSDGDRRPQLQQAFRLADIVGLDVYKSSGTSVGAYERTTALPTEALRLAQQTGKPAMIAELQADNWGSYKANAADTIGLAKHLEKMGYQDMLFWRLSQNLNDDRAGDTRLSDAERTFAQQATRAEAG